MKISVIGAGGWGTAIARLLANNGHGVVLWARNPDRAAEISQARENARYLPGVRLPDVGLVVTDNLADALNVDVVFLAVPSFAMAATLAQVGDTLASDPPTLVNLAKGFDRTTQLTMSELIEQRVSGSQVFTLSGPSHAEEVGRDIPTAVVLAGRDIARGDVLQQEFATPRFRIYVSDDIHGVEVCAAVKNIIALATGISDGLGYGDNSRGALITRGLTEMVRFGRAFDVHDATFYGLSGLGDLVATCTSQHSRNRHVGFRLGRGETIDDIMKEMEMVAEGVYATNVVHRMAEERAIDMPITAAVHRLLRGQTDALSLVDEIMTRAPKREHG